ncbi:MAG: Eco57I restriction-modification methylase domain-containing protein, partial [Candidatus Heimdallarchaeota archaeon]
MTTPNSARQLELSNVTISGGLLTQESLVRLRNDPYNDPTMEPQSYHPTDAEPITRAEFDREVAAIWEWAKERWDEITSMGIWDISTLRNRWILPFLQKLGFKPVFQSRNEDLGGGTGDKRMVFHMSHRGWWDEKKAPRIHTILSTADLDEVTDSDRNTQSPHNALQRYLNLTPHNKWGILTNGQYFRLLRAYYHSYTRGYVQFDLENIFEERDFFEFRLLYLILHSSRFHPQKKEIVPLEAFFERSQAAGIKIGEKLRESVHEALTTLGTALFTPGLKNQLLQDSSKLNDFYAELLRLVYRIMFILFAEQRGMLPGGGTDYARTYSLTRLREMAERPITYDKNVDLWKGLRATFRLVREGSKPLDLTGYNGKLFDSHETPISNDLTCPNDILLQVIRLLTTTQNEGIRQRISFIDINVEEIGAVYESLLDYSPNILTESQEIEGQHYEAGFFALLPRGVERRSTGSYYTDRRLVNLLIESALMPVVEAKLKESDPNIATSQIEALLDLKVCDPACGGGTFLLAAMDYLGKRLAQIVTGRDDPSERNIRNARRKVLQYSIYGVDKNPLAVELAKISMWLHASVANKPLSFLDHHIKCGDSLIGTRTTFLEKGVPINSYVAIGGQISTGIPFEDKSIKNRLRQRLRAQKKSKKGAKGALLPLTSFIGKKEHESYLDQVRELNELTEDDSSAVIHKAEKYDRLQDSKEYIQERLVADFWTSAFFWPLLPEFEEIAPSDVSLREVRQGQVRKSQLSQVTTLRDRYRFFHWETEFPTVFNREEGGFDCILTNPPWETLALKEEEFFAGKAPKVLESTTQANRRKEIKRLEIEHPELHSEYIQTFRALKKTDQFLRNSGIYPLSAKGTLNTYAVFVERCWRLLSPTGSVGMVVPTGVATTYHLQDLFLELVKEKSISSLFDFENRRKLFDIDSRFRFCLLTLSSGTKIQNAIPMAFFCHTPEEVEQALTGISLDEADFEEQIKKLPDDHKLFTLRPTDFKLLNPNTLTCPVFRTRRDFELTRHFYEKTGILIREDAETGKELENPWGISFLRMFDMASASGDFKSVNELKGPEFNGKPVDEQSFGNIWITDKGEYSPLYEGKMVWLYDHRYNSARPAALGLKRKATSESVTLEEHLDPNFLPIPRFWVPKEIIEEKLSDTYPKSRKWFLAFRDITAATNERTLVVSVIPRHGVSHPLPLIITKKEAKSLCLLQANLSSIVMDYIARQKVPGTHMTYFILKQLPVFEPNAYTEEIAEMIVPRVIELNYTSKELSGFAEECGVHRKPFGWDIERRAILMSELDAIYAHLYHISRIDLEYILEAFPITKRNDRNKYG